MSSQWCSLSGALKQWTDFLKKCAIDAVPEVLASLNLSGDHSQAFQDALEKAPIQVTLVSTDKQHFQGAFSTSYLLSTSAKLAKQLKSAAPQTCNNTTALTSLGIASALGGTIVKLSEQRRFYFHFRSEAQELTVDSLGASFPFRLQFAAPGYLNFVLQPRSAPLETPQDANIRDSSAELYALIQQACVQPAPNKPTIPLARPPASTAAPAPLLVAVTLTAAPPPLPELPAHHTPSSSTSTRTADTTTNTIATAAATTTATPHLSSAHTPLPPMYAFSPVATFRSCFEEKYGTPRQGAVCPHARGMLTLAHSIPGDSLAGLENFSHVWLLFVFHANSNTSKQLRSGAIDTIERSNHFSIKTSDIDAAASTSSPSGDCELHYLTSNKVKVVPPKLGVKTGCFASRSPHRVNPIGLTLARVDAVCTHSRTLRLSGVDLIDGTPVLDIKPYHPADALPWGALVAPDWVMDPYLAAVEYSTDAIMRDWARSARESQTRTTLTPIMEHTKVNDSCHVNHLASASSPERTSVASAGDIAPACSDRKRERDAASWELAVGSLNASVAPVCGDSSQPCKRLRAAVDDADTQSPHEAKDANNMPNDFSNTSITPTASSAVSTGPLPSPIPALSSSLPVASASPASLPLCAPRCCIRVRPQALEALRALVHGNQLVRQGELKNSQGKQDTVFSHDIFRRWDRRSPLLEFYGLPGEDETPLLSCVGEVLRTDPRSVHAINKGHGRGIFAVRVDGVDFTYFVSPREEFGSACEFCREKKWEVGLKDKNVCDSADSECGTDDGNVADKMFVEILEITLSSRHWRAPMEDLAVDDNSEENNIRTQAWLARMQAKYHINLD